MVPAEIRHQVINNLHFFLIKRISTAMGRPIRAAKGQPEEGRYKIEVKTTINHTKEGRECGTEYCKLVLLVEPGADREEGEVHGGGGGQEGCAGDEHARTEHQQS